MLVFLSLFIPPFTHILLVRLFGFFKGPFSRQMGVAISCLIGFIPLAVTFFLWAADATAKARIGIAWSFIYLFLVYTLSCYIYFHIFNMSETSRRIRILSECYKRGIEKEKLDQNYACKDMVSTRINRLIGLGELRPYKDKYLLGRGMLVLPAKILLILQGVLYDSRNKKSI